MDDYIGLCERYGLYPVPSNLKNLSLNGLEMLKINDSGDKHKWIFEVDTLPGIGQGDNIISQKRESFTLYEADRLADDVAAMEEEVRILKLELASMRAQLAESSSGSNSILKSDAALGIGSLIAAVMFYF